MENDKIAFKGSHPDSLYRISGDGSEATSKVVRALRLLRWPAALVAVCIALAVFVYFLVPSNIEADIDIVNTTYWETIAAGAQSARNSQKPGHIPIEHTTKKEENSSSHSHDSRMHEIDFYDDEDAKKSNLSVNNDLLTTRQDRKPPIPPVFPTHITPEVQYGNEKADVNKLRTSKILINDTNSVPEESTLKPHITQKPEKPLAVYIKNGNAEITTSTETITRAETIYDYVQIEEKQHSNNILDSSSKTYPIIHKEHSTPNYVYKEIQSNTRKMYPQHITQEHPHIPAYYFRRPFAADVNFTSGHSNLFGISIEDAEKMQSTTQNSLYNTRVSPTLPTWRDGDDATTKNYPTNFNVEVPQCRSTRLPFCRGILPYDLAGNAVKVAGIDVNKLIPQIEHLVSSNCSNRVRHFACALLEPECNPPRYPPKMPCYSLCKTIMDSCEGSIISQDLATILECKQYSELNCVAAKTPCYPNERACSSGLCISRDWICDGKRDCPGGDDEASCLNCDRTEFKCLSGGCIMKRWLCDGYADCPDGEDEESVHCVSKPLATLAEGNMTELGEESAGSAPAPVVRRPNRLSKYSRQGQPRRTGDNDSSKELLMMSDSGNPFKRTFTRRPSPSRLVPYSRGVPEPPESEETVTTKNQNTNSSSDEEPNDFFGQIQITGTTPPPEDEFRIKSSTITLENRAMEPKGKTPISKDLGKSIHTLERVIDGTAMLKNAVEEETSFKDDPVDSPETIANETAIEDFPVDDKPSISAHASPCPSGELRCVDGRCITLSQLCDGTIDCSDHADEDNCFT